MKITSITPLLPAVLLALVVTAAIAGIASTGAPEASTGAPGERNCTAGGCHDDSAINSGPGQLTVKVGLSDTVMTAYDPGKTYPVTVYMQQANIARFGFQAVAIMDGDGKSQSLGTIILDDTARTQSFVGSIFHTNRRYVTYTYAGTTGLGMGWTQWTFQWKAPDVGQTGPVRFYVASVAANDDGTDKGDMAYTTSVRLIPNVVSAVDDGHVSNQSHRMDLR